MKNENMAQIQALSAHFRRLFSLLVLCTPLFTLLYWTGFNHLPPGFTEELPVPVVGALPPLTLALGFLVSMIPAGVTIYGLLVLRELFGLYAGAIVFSDRNVRCFRRLGYSLIAWVLAKLLFIPLISVVLTFHNAPEERMLVLGFGSDELATIIFGAIVVFIARVMDEAARLEDEQAHTV